MIPTNPSCTGRHGSLALASACHAEKKTLLSTPRLKGYSSVGRAAVSKTVGRGFKSCCPCQKIQQKQLDIQWHKIAILQM